MTLKEAFDLLMPGHRPKMEMSESGIWWCLVGSDFVICPEALAESAICWAMVKALLVRENHFGLSKSNDDVRVFSLCMGEEYERLGYGPDAITALAAAYAAVFPKEKA